jgi:hypothetical protein
MFSISTLIVVLAAIWLLGMAWMSFERHGKRAKWVQTDGGGAWIQCQAWPKEGQSVRALGYHGINGVGFNSALAQDGKLSLQDGRFTWNPSGRRSYIS